MFIVEETTMNLKPLNRFTSLSFLDQSELIRVIPVNASITGVTVLGDELFVVRGGSSCIVVYDTKNFSQTRNISIPGSSDLRAIIACSRYNSLFISDVELNVVHHYNLSNNVGSKWSVGGACFGLSLTNANHVLVTSHNTKRLKEYTLDGILVREISLDSSIVYPYHSVQLSSGLFVVSHTGAMHRICIVDTLGRIIRTYGGAPGKGIGFMNTPGHIAVDLHDNVLIADYHNNRVVLLNLSLTHLGYIPALGYDRTNMPWALHLDELHRRLYIAEWTGTGRVLVITAWRNMTAQRDED